MDNIEQTTDKLSRDYIKYFPLFHHISDPLFIVERHTDKILNLNSSALYLIGEEVKNVKNKPFENYFPGFEIPEVIPDDRLTGKNILYAECRRKDGKKIKCSLIIQASSEENRDYIGILIKDIDKTEVQGGFLDNEDYIRLLENIGDGAFFLQDSKFLYVNSSFEKITGFSANEIIGIDFREIIAPEDVDMVSENYAKRLAGEPVPNEYEFNIKHKHKPGYIHIILNIGVVKNREKIAIVGTIKDISVKKENEKLLVLQNELSQKLSKADSIKEISSLSVNYTKKILGINNAGIYLFDNDSKYLELVHYSGLDDEIVEKLKSYDSESLNFKLVKSGKSVFGSISESKVELTELFSENGLNFVGTIPIKLSPGKIYGSLNVAANDADTLTDKKMKFLESIAYMLAIAISRIKSKNKLKESEERFRQLSDLLPQIIYESDLKGNLSYGNKAARDKFGYKPDEVDIDSINAIDMIIPEHRERAVQNMREIAMGQRSKASEYTALRKDGSIFPVAIHSDVIIKDSKPVGFRGVIFDISDVKKVEKALEQNELKFRSILANMSDIVWIVDENVNIKFETPSSCQILGYSENELNEVNMWDLVHPDDKEHSIREFNEVLSGTNKLVPTVFRLLHKDGTYTWHEAVANNLLDVDPINGIIITSRDITARIESEKELQKSNERFIQLFDNMNSACAIHEIVKNEDDEVVDTIIRNANKLFIESFRSIYGIKRTDFVGRKVSELNPKSTFPFADIVYKLNSSDGGIKLVMGFPLKNPVKYFKISIFKFHNNLLATILDDITETKIARDALEANEAKLRSIFEAANTVGFLIADFKDGGPVISEFSPGAENIFGLKKNAVINKKLSEFHRGNYNKVENFIARILQTKAGQSFEVTMMNSNGQKIHTVTSAYPLKNKDGKVLSIIGVTMDITPLKKAEESLHIKNSAIESAVFGLGIASLDGTIEYVNQAYLNLWGYDDIAEIIGKNIKYFGQLGETDRVLGHLNQGGGTVESVAIRKDGSTFDVMVSVNFVRDSKGKPIKLLASFVDISDKKKIENKLHELNKDLEIKVRDRTAQLQDAMEELRFENEERKRTQDELEKLNEELFISRQTIEEEAIRLAELNRIISDSEAGLQESNAMKDKFFSIIAHDLKNPLGGLMNISEILLQNYEDITSDARKNFINILYDSSKQTLNLLENLLQWSRSQTGRLEFHPLIADMRFSIENVRKLLQVNIDNKKIEIIDKSDKNLFAYFDKAMINTVFRNLLSNAIKFTPEGGTIEIANKENDKFIEIIICDSGIGIEEERIDDLFRIDKNSSTPGTNNEKGTGLGLILCKEFVEKNGGTISVKSKPGKGSEFSFTLPKI